jgi:hypothetical protein
MFMPNVPHFSALIGGQRLSPPPVSADYLSGLPADLGMMLNDTLGCCTCAAMYHAIQVWTFACTAVAETNPDADVLAVYEAFCGYNPANPTTDQGGIEQTVLADWMNLGIPVGTAGDKNVLSAWIEVDPRNIDDIKRVIDACGVAYIGFNVPSNIMPQNADPPAVWVYDPSAMNIGGHAIVLAAYDAETVGLISWGKKYQMTWEFFQHYTDEAYALIDTDWVKYTNTTPLGMTLADLVSQMDAIRS